MLPHLSPYREKLQAFLLDKDEHGYGSYPKAERIEHATTVHGAGKSVQLPGRYDKTKIPKGGLAVTSKNGYLVVTKSSTDPDYMWVSHIRVDEKARGKGEGTALYMAALKAAQAQGLKGIRRGDTLGRGISDNAQRVWDSMARKGLTDKITVTTTDPATGKPATYDSEVLVRAEPTSLSFHLDKDEHGYGSYPKSERILIGGREITVHPSDRAKDKGHALVPIDVAKFDAAWQRDTGFHIDPTGHNQIPGRRQTMREFLQTTDRMEAPEAVVQADGTVGFTDGRHRMAAVRDAGVKRLPMTMSPESHANARRHGLLASTAHRLSFREQLQALTLEWDESLHPRDERGRFGETAVGRQIIDHILDSGIGSDHVGMLYSDDAADAMATNFKLDTVRDADIAYARAEIARQSQAMLREKFGDTVVAYRGKTGTEGKTPTTSLSLSPATAKFHAKGRGITRHAVPVSDVLSYSEAVGKGTFAEQEIIVKPKTLALSYRDKLERFTLAGWEEALHPRDEIGRFAESEGRDFKGNEGYEWFEHGPVADYASTVSYEDANAISSYASFSYGDINKQLRGEFTPRTVDDTVRDATAAEIAAFQHPPMGHGQHASDYDEHDPLNKVADGRIVHNFYYEGGYKPDDRAANERNRVDTYTIEKAGPDTKYVKELETKTNTINAAIRERGYVLPEAIKVNRAAYIPGMTYDDVKNLEGKVIEEKGFTSTMVGNPSNRLDGYVAIGKSESLYKQYADKEGSTAIYTHQDEPGASMRISITLPEGTKVAPVEAIRRVEHEFPRKVIPLPDSLKDDEFFKKHPEAYTERDYKAKPTIKTSMLQEKDKRTEAEILLGSGAQFRIKSVQRGEKRIVTSDPKMKPIDVIDVQMEYVGGGSSEGK